MCHSSITFKEFQFVLQCLQAVYLKVAGIHLLTCPCWCAVSLRLAVKNVQRPLSLLVTRSKLK